MASSNKIYILDTNVLIYDPKSIFSFDTNTVGIPVFVLEELDKLKSESSQRGYNCRQVIRLLDSLTSKGSLRDGVNLDNGGRLKILFDIERKGVCDLPFSKDITDNKILMTAFCEKQKNNEVIFVSKDINARVKADVLNIEAIDYEKGSVSKEELYRGWIKVSASSLSLKKELPEELRTLENEHRLVPNEFIILESSNNPHNYKVFRYISKGKFKPVVTPKLRWPLEPRNVNQLMALDLLLDPEIQLISLIGPAGTGKTFLALLAGLQQVVIEQLYEKILVSRPVIPLGPDIGYLPGDIHEKLFSWMQPVYDNMDFITHSANTQGASKAQGAQGGSSIYYEDNFKGTSSRYKRKKKQETKAKSMPTLDDLIREDKLSLEAITYMRGRSIPYQFIIIDEVQNLTPHEVKTLITRVGTGSKMILSGDPYQIDSPYLDFSSNGLVIASDRFKGQSLFGTVYLEVSERSELSRLASELL